MKRALNAMKNNKMVRETFWAVAAKGIVFVLFYFIQIFLARKMDVVVWGQWTAFNAMLMIVLLCSNMGINFSAKKFIAQHNETGSLRSAISGALLLRFFGSLLFCGLLVVLYKPLLTLLKKKQFTELFFISVPLVFVFGFVEYFTAVFEGLHRLKYSFFVKSVEFGFKLLFVVLLFGEQVSLANVVWAFLFATILAAVVGGLFLYFRFYRSAPASDGSCYIKEIARYSLPIFITSVGFIVAMEIDAIMLSSLHGDYETGIYGVAKQIVGKLPQIALALSMGTAPVFAKLCADNSAKLKVQYNKILRFVLFIFIAITLVILVLAGWFVPLIFGEKYLGSVLALRLLAPYVLFMGAAVYSGAVLDYMGYAARRSVGLGISIVFNIVLNLLLIPEYGSAGAAIATSVSYLPYFLFTLLETRRHFR